MGSFLQDGNIACYVSGFFFKWLTAVAKSDLLGNFCHLLWEDHVQEITLQHLENQIWQQRSIKVVLSWHITGRIPVLEKPTHI